MQVSDVYEPQLLTCEASDRLPDVARRMAEEEVSALAVVKGGGRMVGIISERDITRAMGAESDPRTVTAAQYATTGVEVAYLGDDTDQVTYRMLEAEIRHLPVLDEGEVVGMVSMRDLLAAGAWGK